MNENNIEKWQAYLFLSWFTHIALIIITNIAMWAIYHIELPFFERYKINNEKWPWY